MKDLSTPTKPRMLFVFLTFMVGFWVGFGVTAYFLYTAIEPDALCDTFWQFLNSVECIVEKR